MNTLMSDDNRLDRSNPTPEVSPPEEAYIIPTVVEEPHLQAGTPPPRVLRRRLRLPLLLFIATCLSTFIAGGWAYALSIMCILICHEAGHFLQARRYGVYTSFPYFIPMPISPFGTLGAVIAMSPRIRDRRALFDIGITGPLAGLVPTLICCVVGVQLSHPAPLGPNAIQYGDPILLKLLYRWQFGALPEGWDVTLNPILWAGWVGLFVTALNLIPIGQLDGGHVLYAIMRRRAHRVAIMLLVAAAVLLAVAAVAVAVFRHVWWSPIILWTPMIILLAVIGPKHPPTARDHVPLGFWRHVLGWLILAFVAISFTPRPVISPNPFFPP